jgi:hypothetical protein
VDDFRQLTGLDQATGDDTITLARTAAEAIRGLNWLTRCQAGLGQPSAAYDVIGALAQAASRLPLALAQVTRRLGQALAAGRLGHDPGEDPAAATGAAAVFPGDARMSAAHTGATAATPEEEHASPRTKSTAPAADAPIPETGPP